MKEQIVYIAEDGTRFDSKNDCEKYENLCITVNKLMKLLPSKPDTCDFANGKGYIRHKKEDVLKVRRHLMELCKPYSDHHWIQETIDKDNAHISFALRIIGEYKELTPISRALYRFHAMDTEYREYGQVYFATHQDQAENICLNQK